MMTAVIAYLWLKEAVSFIDWLAIFTSFFGIIVIQNPWARIAMEREEGSEKSHLDTAGSIAAIVGAVFFAIS